MKKILLPAILLFSLSACDVIEGPIKEVSDNTPIDTTTAVQKILIEEFTGHQCGNCPEGAQKIAELKAFYGDRLIPVSVHLGFFAKVKTSGSKYTYDFNTQAGKDLDQTFSVDVGGAYPAAFVNRKVFNANLKLGKDAWSPAISNIMSTTPAQKIKLSTSYNEATRQLSVTADVTYLKAGAADDHFTLYLTEDSIINWQKDYLASPEDIQNYVHRHVLRAALSPTLGDALSTAAIPAGTKFSKTYTITLKDEYVPKHCSVVGFVNNLSSKEILQVEEKHIN